MSATQTGRRRLQPRPRADAFAVEFGRASMNAAIRNALGMDVQHLITMNAHRRRMETEHG